MKIQQINKLTRHKVVASGGIRNKADLDELETLGIEEAIVGKASHTTKNSGGHQMS